MELLKPYETTAFLSLLTRLPSLTKLTFNLFDIDCQSLVMGDQNRISRKISTWQCIPALLQILCVTSESRQPEMTLSDAPPVHQLFNETLLTGERHKQTLGYMAVRTGIEEQGLAIYDSHFFFTSEEGTVVMQHAARSAHSALWGLHGKVTPSAVNPMNSLQSQEQH